MDQSKHSTTAPVPVFVSILFAEKLRKAGFSVSPCHSLKELMDALPKAHLVFLEAAGATPDVLATLQSFGNVGAVLVAENESGIFEGLPDHVAVVDEGASLGALHAAVRGTLNTIALQQALEAGATQLTRTISHESELEAHGQAVQENLQTLINSINDVFVIVDSAWFIRQANQKAAEIAGRDQAELSGLGLFELLADDGQQSLRTRMEQAMMEQTPGLLEVWDKQAELWFEYRLYPAVDELMIIRADINERKASEVRHQLLVELNEVIRPFQDPRIIMRTAGTVVCKHLQVSKCEYGEAVGDNEYITAGLEYCDGVLTPVSTYSTHHLTPQMVAQLRTGSALQVTDLHKDSRAGGQGERLAELMEARAVLCVPVVKQGRLAALFLLFSKHPRVWTEAVINVVQHVAERTWLGVESARAEKALVDSEEQLELAVDGSRGGMFDMKLDPNNPGRTPDSVYLSPRLKKFLGYMDQELQNSLAAWEAHIPEEDLERVRVIGAEHFAGHTEFMEVEHRVRHRDGSIRWMQSRSRIKRDEQNRPTRWVGITWDITSRKHSEEQKSLLAAIVDSSYDSIIGKSLSGEITSWNMGAERIFGYTSEEIVGRHMSVLVPPEQQEQQSKILDRVKTGERVEQVESLRIRKNGQEFYVSLTMCPIYGASGDVIAASAIERDITEARRRAEEAEEGIQILQALMDNIPEGITIASGPPDFTVRTSSKYGIKLVGTGRDALAGLSEPDSATGSRLFMADGTTVPKPSQLPLYRATRYGQVVLNEEWNLVKEDSGLLPLLCNAGPIRDVHGNITGGVLSWRDITERKQAERQLQEANETLEQRVRERTKSLMRQREQLRLMAIELSSAEQRERRRLAADLHDYLAQLLVVCRMKLSTTNEYAKQAAVKKLLAEMDALLDQSLTYTRTLVSRLSPTILYEAGLAAACKWLSEQMQNEGLQVTFMQSGDQILLPDDQAILIFQAIRELFHNIIKHSGVEEAALSLVSRDGRVRVIVEDSGAGFSQNSLEQGSSERGRFGLFNVRERIEALGGTFWIESAPGAGTRAIMDLPTQTPEPSHEPQRPRRTVVKAPKPGPRAAGEITRIMLVDDHSIVRDGLRRIIEANDDLVVVGEAATGEDAVKTIQSIMPDVVVMDINMPRMNGIEATRIIKQDMPHVIVIGLSLEDNADVIASMKEAGASAFVNKNGPSGEFCQILRGCLPKPAPGKASTPT